MKKQKEISPKMFSLKRMVVLIIVVVALFALWPILDHVADQHKQNQAFQKAASECGKEPVVIVYKEVSFGGKQYEHTVYSPEHPEYHRVKTLVDKPELFSFETEYVEAYRCSLDEASQFKREGYGGEVENNAENYSQDEQRTIKQDIIANLERANMKFFDPSFHPAGLVLSNMSLGRDGYSHNYQTSANYKESRNNTPAGSDLFLYCSPVSQSYTTDSLAGHPTAHQLGKLSKDVGANTVDERIVYVQSDKLWYTRLGGTQCTLKADEDSTISQGAGTELMQSLGQADLNRLLDADLSI